MLIGTAVRLRAEFAESDFAKETLVHIVGRNELCPRRIIVRRLSPPEFVGHEFSVGREELIARWEIWSAAGWNRFTPEVFEQHRRQCVMPPRSDETERCGPDNDPLDKFLNHHSSRIPQV